MTYPPIGLLVVYTLYAFFSYYVQRWAVGFRGGSQGFHFMLTITAFASTVFGIGFLIYYAYSVSIWAAVITAVVGFAANLPLVMIEARLNLQFAVGLIGLAAIPILAFLMLDYV
jgi:hypothetical protein